LLLQRKVFPLISKFKISAIRRPNFSHVFRTQAFPSVIDWNAQNAEQNSQERERHSSCEKSVFCLSYILVNSRRKPTRTFQVWRKSCGVKWGPKDMVGPNVSLWLTVPEGGTIATQGASFRTPSEHERTNTELATLCKVKLFVGNNWNVSLALKIKK